MRRGGRLIHHGSSSFSREIISMQRKSMAWFLLTNHGFSPLYQTKLNESSVYLIAQRKSTLQQRLMHPATSSKRLSVNPSEGGGAFVVFYAVACKVQDVGALPLLLCAGVIIMQLAVAACSGNIMRVGKRKNTNGHAKLKAQNAYVACRMRWQYKQFGGSLRRRSGANDDF